MKNADNFVTPDRRARFLTSAPERHRISIQGIVQDVGFRSFIYGQALHWGLTGFVLNDTYGVTIEVEGTLRALKGFERTLCKQPPPLSRIDAVTTEKIPLRREKAFVIVHSQAGLERDALIAPDTATCADCLRELFDPGDRRYHYPFINCTNCGPRFTIVEDVPYDRDKTTMRVFPMCPDCQREYDYPLNRRFHAQPNACPVCGPQVSFFEGPCRSGCPEEGPIELAARRLAEGAILAIKGLGCYQLACDALNVEVVQRLRQRKHRETKPFALMVPDLETARRLCKVSAEEATLLQSRQRPIVLLKQQTGCPVAPDVAPSHNTLGVMLPCTPLHFLLLDACAQVFASNRPVVLVMTSGNLSDGPIAYRDKDALERLASIADGILLHNREIHTRCDDSVVRVTAYGEQVFRRSRSYVPEPIPLALEFPVPLLACGGHLKNTFCVGKGRQAFVSHHIGDLENRETLLSFREAIEHFQRLFDIVPEAVAYDLHPEYLATKYALDSDIPEKIGVQHHHAHIASVLAEHGLTGPVIGIAADGTGYGTDGAVWGCEVMVADLLNFDRVLHLRYVPLIGGEQVVRQPWCMAAAYLAQAYGNAFMDLDIPFVHKIERSEWQMIERGISWPQTSSLGRLFDAVAALVGLPAGTTQLYEGQAAIELEMQASGNGFQAGRQGCYPFTITDGLPAKLDVTPLIRAIVKDIQRGTAVPQIAARFHCAVADMLTTACNRVRKQTRLNTVALSGDLFQNRLLLEQLMARLQEMAFRVYLNRRVPPNDGGLSLGQIAIAAARLRKI